jgi:aminopeptidase N
MANEDFYVSASQARAAQLEAEKAAALADLSAHKANGDVESAAEAVQRIADIDAARQNLETLYRNYARSQQAPQQAEVSDEERAARPWERMTPDDGLALARTSKYGRDLNWSDPHVAAAWREVQRRKARGE